MSNYVILYFLRWTPSRTPNRGSQYVIVDITEPSGVRRRVEERCQNEHQDVFPLRVAPGSTFDWWVKTVDKYGQSFSAPGGHFMAGEPLLPMPATNLGVDLQADRDELSPPSGTVVYTPPAAEPASQPQPQQEPTPVTPAATETSTDSVAGSAGSDTTPGGDSGDQSSTEQTGSASVQPTTPPAAPAAPPRPGGPRPGNQRTMSARP